MTLIADRCLELVRNEDMTDPMQLVMLEFDAYWYRGFGFWKQDGNGDLGVSDLIG